VDNFKSFITGTQTNYNVNVVLLGFITGTQLPHLPRTSNKQPARCRAHNSLNENGVSSVGGSQDAATFDVFLDLVVDADCHLSPRRV